MRHVCIFPSPRFIQNHLFRPLLVDPNQTPHRSHSLTWLLSPHIRVRAGHHLTLHLGISRHIIVKSVEPHGTIICCERPLSYDLTKLTSDWWVPYENIKLPSCILGVALIIDYARTNGNMCLHVQSVFLPPLVFSNYLHPCTPCTGNMRHPLCRRVKQSKVKWSKANSIKKEIMQTTEQGQPEDAVLYIATIT